MRTLDIKIKNGSEDRLMYFVVNLARELGDLTGASFESLLAGRCVRHKRNFLVEFFSDFTIAKLCHGSCTVEM